MGMHNTLYIPKTITVGFQERRDTFTGKLGYVIYTDHKGILRKESSWQSWRDKNIESITVNNDPQKGFTFNKGIQRDRYWGSGRSVIRVWDPRNFEFEISVDNLIGILMHADVSKRDITEPCVFAWNRNELILLPTNSLEYQESLKHTEKQGIKFSAKDLVVGYTYGIKQDSTTRVVYLGYHDQYDIEPVLSGPKPTSGNRYNSDYPNTIGYKGVKKKKKHVFINEQSKNVELRDPSAYISCAILEESHPNFAALMDEYYKYQCSQPMAGVELIKSDYQGYNDWYRVGDEYFRARVDERWSGYADNNSRMTYSMEVIQYAKYDPTTQVLSVSYNDRRGYYNTRIQGNPTSLHDNHPAVKEIMKQVLEVYNQYPTTRDWQRSNEIRATRNEVLAARGLGAELRIKLANGNAANQRFYI